MRPQLVRLERKEPLSRRSPFVGRGRELRQLCADFEAAATGPDGVLVLLVGEPGIGKTRLCQEVADFVSGHGGLPLVGHCYEPGSFRPPYQPFVEVFGSYLQQSEVEATRSELSSCAEDLARIVPMLRERLNVTPRLPGDPEEDRWRLLQAASDVLHKAAAKQPLLLVLEDLHDADSATLDLLLYVARNLRGARLLVVGTYRDLEVDRAHPLSAALSELHRSTNTTRLHLRGLSTDEVLHLLAETSQQRVLQPFADLVHRQTDGNPLFVRETLRFVLDEGLVEPRDGVLRRIGEQSLVGRIPEGLRDAVGKRLSRLSDNSNRVLRIASVVGRDFQLDVLRHVFAGPEEELEDALEEAATAGIIEEQSVIRTAVTYRFSHAFFRQTLYDEILAPRRIRIHRQVAYALEASNARRLDEHASELAEHYAFSSDAMDLAKAVHYGEVAGTRATEVFAYREAAGQLERALEVLALLPAQDAAQHCDLLLSLGEALWPLGEGGRVIEQVAPEALTVAEALGDGRRAFRACQVALDAFVARDGTASMALPEYLRWAQRAREYATNDSVERVHADLALANALVAQSQLQAARSLRLQALKLARQLGDPEALFRSAFWLFTTGCIPDFWAERVELAEECVGWSCEGVSARVVGAVLWMSGCLQLAKGERARAEELWRQIEELAERTHIVTVKLFLPQREATLAIIDGRLEDSLDLVRQYVQRAD
jgi:hypothetical protein